MSIGNGKIAETEETAGGDLKGMMSQVLQHITDADRRNGVLLREMQERLEVLSHDARLSRPRVPNEYLPGFERIEDGISMLAGRIAQSYSMRIDANETSRAQTGVDAAPATAVEPEPQIPAPVPQTPVHALAAAQSEQPNALRSTLPGLPRARNANYPSNIDTFDVIESLPGNPTEAWSPDQAAALSDVYSSREALFANPADSIDAPSAHGTSHTEAASSEMTGCDRNWIDQRLTDIAVRVERSLAASRSDVALVSLEHRFGEFEHRLSATLGGLATKVDVDSLNQIESQIHHLRRQFEQAHAELVRIDDLERQLTNLVQQVSDENLGAVVGRAMPSAGPDTNAPRADVEFHSVAIAAAEAAAARVAKSQSNGRVDDVHALLSNFIHERRQGEEQTAVTLDTLQHAMLRILDRVEAIETAPVVHTDHADDDGHVEAHHEPAQVHAPVQSVEPHFADEEPVHQPEPAPTSDYLSQQRAKMQASVQRAASAQRDKLNVQPSEPATNVRTQRTAKPAAKNGSRRLMVSSLALAVLAGGASAFVMMIPRDGTKMVAVPVAPELSAPVGITQVPKSAQLNSLTIEAAAPSLAFDEQTAQKTEAPTGLSPRAVPETVTDDLGQNGSPVRETDRVPEANQARANLAKSQYTTPTAVKGVLLQKSASVEPDAVIPAKTSSNLVAAEAIGVAAKAVAVAAHPEDVAPAPPAETEQPRGAALDLPPATVGPLSLRLAAARGDKSAEFEVASRLAEGKGTEQNLKEAVRWYQRSATQGFVQAQYRLGTFFERGLGVKADMGRARSWYQRSAEQGNVKAMHNLAVLAAGRGSESPDYTTAAHWFGQAASYGLPDSQFNLAVLTESGLGVEKDLVQAAMWFTIAARSGDKEAVRRRDMMKSKMQPADLAAAEHLAKTWQPLVQEKIANDPHFAGEAWKSIQAVPDKG